VIMTEEKERLSRKRQVSDRTGATGGVGLGESSGRDG